MCDVYVIDTSSINKLFERYPPDIFPKLYEYIDNLINKGKLISHIFVLRELGNLKDTEKEFIYNYFRKRRKMFKGITSFQIKIIEDIFGSNKKFIKFLAPAKKKNIYHADPFIVALAFELKNKHSKLKNIEVCVVSEETTKPNENELYKMPDVCDFLGIKHINLIELFRIEKIKLI